MSGQTGQENQESNEKLFNATFNGNGPTWANACVGENGLQNLEVYIDGYKKAPLVLMDEVIKQGGLTLLVDTLIFPIAFTIRHAVELQIKDSVTKLDEIRRNQEIKNYKSLTLLLAPLQQLRKLMQH